MRLRRLVPMLFIVAMMASLAHAETLVYYDLMGVIHTPAPKSVPASTVVDGLTALDLTRGPGINPASLNNGFSADHWHNSRSREDALAIGAYFQFGFKIQQGYTVSLSTLDFTLRRSAVTAPMNIEVQVSLDGFQTPGIVVANLTYLGRTSGTAPAVDPLKTDPYYYMKNDLPGRPNEVTSVGDPVPTIDLSGIAALQNIPGGTEVTFRIYAWGNDRTTETNTLALGRVVGPAIGGTISKVN